VLLGPLLGACIALSAAGGRVFFCSLLGSYVLLCGVEGLVLPRPLLILGTFSFICQGTSTRRQRSEILVVVVLPDPFRGMGAWRKSSETQLSAHARRSGPQIKDGRSSAKDGAPERLRCGTIQ